MRRPWSMALPVSKFSPPSEKELLVTFRMPMTRVRSVGKSAKVFRVAFRTTVRGPVAGPVPGTAPIDMGILPIWFCGPGLVYSGVQYQTHGLVAGGWFAQLAAHRRRHGLGVWFLYPAHGHAHVFGGHHHDGAGRVEVFHNRFDDLGGQAFLDLGTAGVEVHQAGQFRQPGDLAFLRRDVADVGVSVERDQVVLAHRIKRDVFDQDQLFVRKVKGGAQDFGRVPVQAGKEFAVGPGNPGRGIYQAFAVWVFAHGKQNFTDRSLDPRLINHLVLLVRAVRCIVVDGIRWGHRDGPVMRTAIRGGTFRHIDRWHIRYRAVFVEWAGV